MNATRDAADRSSALATWATGHGLGYGADDDGMLVWNFPPIAHDLDHHVRDVVHGTFRGRPILACNLYGRIPEVAFAATTVEADCPPLTIAHESYRHLVERHAAVLTYETELDAFNQEWEILCPDLAFANALVDQSMIRWIVDSEPPERERTFAVEGPFAMCFVPLPPLDRLDLAIDAALDFAGRIPAVVIDEYPGAAPIDPWPR